MKSKRPATQNAGAALERQATRQWAERRPGVTKDALLKYLAGRAKRNKQRPGGLGRKAK